MKPIQTIYKGYKFRSRLEARYAVWFDSLGQPWEYEKEGYELKGGFYLPDFWLPELGVWLEVKGEEPTEQERKLCEELGEHTDRAVALVSGLPSRLRFSVLCGDLNDSGGG